MDRNNKLGTTKYTIFQMNKLRLECKQILKTEQEVLHEIQSRNVPSKSLVERKRVARDCYTERTGNSTSQQLDMPREKYNIFGQNYIESKNTSHHSKIHTAHKLTDVDSILPQIKLPIVNPSTIERNSAPLYVVHPKAVSVVKGQPLFAKRKKAINPFTGHIDSTEQVKSRLHFLNRVRNEKRMASGHCTPSNEIEFMTGSKDNQVTNLE